MMRFKTLALAFAPFALAAPVAVVAQSSAPLSQVQAHLKAVDTMTAAFSQTDRNGQVLNGTLTLKRPGVR